jgi:hypothetical protein
MCAVGYNLANNQCVYDIANCLEIVDKKCTKCATSFAVTSIGTCDLVPRIPNCIDQNGLVCNACDTGFSLSNNICTYFI